MKRDCLERLAKIKNKKSIIKTINFTNKFWREILIKSKRLKIRKCKITWAHRFWALKSSNKKFILNKIKITKNFKINIAQDCFRQI
jgi:hypothetical protein